MSIDAEVVATDEASGKDDRRSGEPVICSLLGRHRTGVGLLRRSPCSSVVCYLIGMMGTYRNLFWITHFLRI